ncbi:TPA: hypothetical protein ACFNMI_001562 [Neisseria bacilliformis]|nr:hypothetical protein [Neisseria bacilliformis]
MPAVITAPEKFAAAQTLLAVTLLAALPQKAACTWDIQTCRLLFLSPRSDFSIA